MFTVRMLQPRDRVHLSSHDSCTELTVPFIFWKGRVKKSVREIHRGYGCWHWRTASLWPAAAYTCIIIWLGLEESWFTHANCKQSAPVIRRVGIYGESSNWLRCMSPSVLCPRWPLTHTRVLSDEAICLLKRAKNSAFERNKDWVKNWPFFVM